MREIAWLVIIYLFPAIYREGNGVNEGGTREGRAMGRWRCDSFSMVSFADLAVVERILATFCICM